MRKDGESTGKNETAVCGGPNPEAPALVSRNPHPVAPTGRLRRGDGSGRLHRGQHLGRQGGRRCRHTEVDLRRIQDGRITGVGPRWATPRPGRHGVSDHEGLGRLGGLPGIADDAAKRLRLHAQALRQAIGAGPPSPCEGKSTSGRPGI